MFERFFRLSESRTDLKTELLAGITTFLTMAYIIFVQPAVLSGAMFGAPTGMDFGAVMFATCVAAAIASFVMGIYGRYPIALAPGMGENFFFVLSVIPAAAAAGSPAPWQTALGVVFISGVLFFLLYLLGIREKIFDSISPSMKHGMAVGIGFFIAFIGLQNAGVVIHSSGTLVQLNTRFSSPDLIVFLAGLFVASGLHSRKVRGSLLWGIVAAAVLALAMRIAVPVLAPDAWNSELFAGSKMRTMLKLPDRTLPFWQWIVSLPPDPSPVLMKMDIIGALSPAMIYFIVVFLFMDVLDTIGTLVGVGEQAGFIVDNKLPRARQAMLADQSGTIVGSVLGTSTVTSYIESAAGVEAGGRTGLTSCVVAVCFLLALFFSPVVALIGSYAPVTAPALVLVGAMMVRSVNRIDWSDYTESVPAFLTMMGIPLSYSIADGLAFGFISYAAIKLFAGRGRETAWVNYVLAGILLLYFIFLRSGR